MTLSAACANEWHEDCPATNERPEDRVPCDCACGHEPGEYDPEFWRKVARAQGANDDVIMTAAELEALLTGKGVPTIRFGVDA